VVVVVVVVVASLHSAIFARNDTTIPALMVPIQHLHSDDVVLCNAWYTLPLEKSRRRGVLLA
jgi:hypothetical protein